MINNKKSILYRFFFIQTTFSPLSSIFILIIGIIAYQSIIKEFTPELEIPQALITVELLGASPNFIEKEITLKIEQKIKSLPGLKRYRSGSMDSISIISVEFDVETKMKDSMRILRDKVREVESVLPKKAKKPVIEQILVADFPVIAFLLYSKLDQSKLHKQAYYIMEKLQKLDGVRRVDIDGDRKEIIEVKLNPELLRSLNISTSHVVERIKEENLDMPWGKFYNDDFKLNFKLQGKLQSLDEFKNLPIKRFENGQLIRLKEIADVKKTLDTEKTKAYFSRHGIEYQKSVALLLYKLPGIDSIDLVEKAKALMKKNKSSDDWPDTIDYEVMLDESILIKHNLKTIFNNIWQAMLAVSFVLFIMLAWREAIIASFSIPLTFLGLISIL
jgi:multidrug efflux pump subunit AcrB